MSQYGFFAANRCRAFPFLEGTTAAAPTGPLTLASLPDAVVVDCGFLFGPGAGWDPTRHAVVLARIVRAGATASFEFVCDAPGLLGSSLWFQFDLAAPLYALAWADSGETVEWGSASASTSTSTSTSDPGGAAARCGRPLWSGYLAVGDLGALDAFLAGDGQVGRGDGCVVEPVLAQTLDGAAVTSAAVANQDRTRAEAPEGCPPIVWPYETGKPFVNASCLTGLLQFRGGYNVAVRAGAADNSLTFAAAPGGGAGYPCGELKLDPQEEPPPGSTSLAGGPRCNEVLRSLNGVGGPLLQLAGDGVVFTPRPEEYKLTIDVNMAGLATCFDVVSESLSLPGEAP